MALGSVIYRISFVIFVILFVALLVVTPIDTILRSQHSGQFWNVIIIVVAYTLTVAIIVFFFLGRFWRARRTLADVPRRYIPRADDLDHESAREIAKERTRCEEIVRQCSPSSRGARVSHPGLLPPDAIELESGTDAPFSVVAATLVSFVEAKATAIHESFGRPKGMAIREYIARLQDNGVIRPVDSAVAEEFTTRYEQIRFSGLPIHANYFAEYLETCFRLLFALGHPNMNMGISGNRSSYGASMTSFEEAGLSSSSDLVKMLSRTQDWKATFLENPRQVPLSPVSTVLSPFQSYDPRPRQDSDSSASGSVIFRPN